MGLASGDFFRGAFSLRAPVWEGGQEGFYLFREEGDSLGAPVWEEVGRAFTGFWEEGFSLRIPVWEGGREGFYRVWGGGFLVAHSGWGGGSGGLLQGLGRRVSRCALSGMGGGSGGLLRRFGRGATRWGLQCGRKRARLQDDPGVLLDRTSAGAEEKFWASIGAWILFPRWCLHVSGMS